MGDLITNTPYDDAYRTMYVQCDELVLPLLNEVFKEHYIGTERIIRRGNEHYDMQQGGAEDKRITDSFLEVVGSTIKKYHCECESGADGSVLIRMFQYGAQIALEDAVMVSSNELCVEFPNAAVVYLRSTDSTPDQMNITIKTPSGEKVTYPIKTIKVSSYSVDDLFEKRLYFLIPFYIFNVEKELKECNDDSEKLKRLMNLYADIMKRLEQEDLSGKIKSIDRLAVRDLASKVAQNLAIKYENVRKGIGAVMGGQVLDLEVFRIRDAGREEGREAEREEFVRKLLSKGKSAEIIADDLDLDVSFVKSIEEKMLSSVENP